MTAIPQPPLCDWAWRPGPWDGAGAVDGPVAPGTDLGPDIRLFHDGDAPVALGLDGAGLAVDAGPVPGGFVSLAVKLPDDGVAGLSPRAILGVRMALDHYPADPVALRLNIRKGPNTEALPGLPIPGTLGDRIVMEEFDLAFRDIATGRVSEAWLDVIFDRAGGLRLTIEDLTLTRRPRAVF